ncbi:MAG: 6-phosphogluconolactonase [Cyanobacteria bacterium J06627_28]
MNTSAVMPLKCFQRDRLSVEIYETGAEVAIAASTQAEAILQKAIDKQGSAAAVFATGRSQIQCLQHLTRQGSSVDWKNVTGFHLDEYLGIAADHPASFHRYLKTHLTSKVALKRFYAIAGDSPLPVEFCDDYTRQLRAQPLDLGFLGIGENGHLAFNDPGVANFDDARWVKLVRLDPKNRQQQLNSTAFDTIESVPQYAFTLTLSAICSLRHSLCLAMGEGKAKIVNTMLSGLTTPDCPASILRKKAGATLLLDLAAASLLPVEQFQVEQFQVEQFSTEDGTAPGHESCAGF